MEKGDFTPEEFRAYREEQGLGWPPESTFDFIKRLVAEWEAQHPDFDRDRIMRRMTELRDAGS